MAPRHKSISSAVQCSRRSMREMQQAADCIRVGYTLTFTAGDIRGKQQGRQINVDLQEIRFKNSDPTPTHPW